MKIEIARVKVGSFPTKDALSSKGGWVEMSLRTCFFSLFRAHGEHAVSAYYGILSLQSIHITPHSSPKLPHVYKYSLKLKKKLQTTTLVIQANAPGAFF